MKRITPLLILLAFGMILGCDDDDDNGTDNRNNPPQRVTANTTAGTPTMDDPYEEIWAGVDSTTIAVGGGYTPKLAPGGQAAAIPAGVQVQAVKTGEFLFLRLTWADPTNDAWPDYWGVTATDPAVVFTQNAEQADEDRIVVLFQDTVTTNAFDYDAWTWSPVRTGAANLGTGQFLRNDSIFPDAQGTVADLDPAIWNRQFDFDAPLYMSVDGSDFTGSVLYAADTTPFSATAGWAMEDRIPGWVVDTTVGGDTYTDEERGSQWDIRAVGAYDSTASEYVVVLRTALNTGSADDIDLTALDSVGVIISIFDNQDDFRQGSNRRGFTPKFWLILPE